MHEPMPRLKGSQAAWALIGLTLVAINLRPALSGVSPLLAEIRADLGLGATGAGLLTTAPVLCLGLFGALAPRVGARLGNERAVLVLLGLLAGGILVRSLGNIPALFLGSILGGAAIGIVNVLLPALIKRDFPHRIGSVTGLYTMALCIGAAAAAGLTAPTEEWLDTGWRLSLAIWAIPPVLAGLIWLPQIGRAARSAANGARRTVNLWRNALAWQVTLFMGLQSSLAYSVFGWLPVILQDRGMTKVESGLVVSVSILFQVITSFTAPILAGRCRDQRLISVAVVGLSILGLTGAMLAPLSTIWLWSAILGLGQGATFAVALMLIVLRSPDPAHAASLSGMAQSVGYTLAACGPFAVGLLHAWTDGWMAVEIMFVVIAGASMLAGLGAGRAKLVKAG